MLSYHIFPNFDQNYYQMLILIKSTQNIILLGFMKP